MVDIKSTSNITRFSTPINEGSKRKEVALNKMATSPITGKKSGKKNLCGLKFGRLTVLEECGINKYHSILWKCLCDCGCETKCSSASLLAGNSKSCGCYRLERLRKKTIKHGESKDRLYHCWQSMKDRCNNKNNLEYYRYGGRGITVCYEWLTLYENFRKWAMDNGYNQTLTIDRIDFNGCYSPENCRWITIQENAKNTSICIIFDINGIRDTLRGWSLRLMVVESTFRRKYKEVGRDVFGSLIKECLITGNKSIFSKQWKT